MKSSNGILLACIFAWVAVAAAAAGFTAKPAVTRSDAKVAISFTLNAPTDVEVAVLDANGQVVRHLAAGVLGGDTPPPAPLKSGLAQEVAWDGLDDYGRSAPGDPFKVRVRSGVRPAFEKSVSIKVFDGQAVSYGPGGLDSSGEFIEMTNPIFMNGTKLHSPDPARMKFYAGSTRIDMVVSDESDEILLQCGTFKSGPSGKWGKSVPIARFNGLTGELIGLLPSNKGPWGSAFGTMGGGEPVMDWFGKYFLHDRYSGGQPNRPEDWEVVRLTLDGKAFPFPDGSNKFLQPAQRRSYVHPRGMAVGPDSHIYIAQIPVADEQDPIRAQCNFVRTFDENGKLLKDGLVQVYGPVVQGVNLDLKGNIFVGVGVRPAGKPVPEEIAGKLDGKTDDPFSRAAWGPAIYGSILKFGPEGGHVIPDAKGEMESKGYNNAKMTRVSGQGIKWMHYGASFQPTHNGEINMKCFCFTPRFDVDRFGRVIFPNPFQNEFKCLDNEGNLIFRVHNRDFAAQAKVGCATTVQTTDRGIYVADHPNNQILIFRWQAETEDLLLVP